MSKVNNIFQSLSFFDWVVFITVLMVTFLAVLYGHKLKNKEEKEENHILELLLMGRRLTLPLFVSTLVATWYGGIFGVTQIAFEKGLYNFLTQGVFWYIAYLIFAFFIVDRMASYKAITLPDLVGKLFGPKASKLSALFNFFNVLPIAYVISLGLFLKILFGGPLILMMAFGILVVILYSIWGGLRAVVFSDLIQFVVMCGSVALILFFSIGTYGGLDFLLKSLPESHFSLTGGESLGVTLVWGFIALSTLVDPNFYQRCFAAESPKVAKKGILISTCIWVLFDLCTTFGAMYARAVMPEADSGQAYIIYALQVLPDGLKGFVLAGILATILSTLDSYLFLAGTTISYDLLPNRFRNRKWAHYFGVLGVGILSLILAELFQGNVKTVWKTLGSYSAACMLFPVLFAYIFPKKIGDGQFVFGCLMGVIMVTYWRNWPPKGFLEGMDEFYMGLIATGFGILFYPLIDQLKKKIFS